MIGVVSSVPLACGGPSEHLAMTGLLLSQSMSTSVYSLLAWKFEWHHSSHSSYLLPSYVFLDMSNTAQ